MDVFNCLAHIFLGSISKIINYLHRLLFILLVISKLRRVIVMMLIGIYVFENGGIQILRNNLIRSFWLLSSLYIWFLSEI